MNDTPDQPAPRKTTPTWHWAVYALLLATSIYAAVLVCQRVLAPPRPAASAGGRSRPGYDTGRLDRSTEDDFWTGRGDGPKDLPAMIARSLRAGTLEQQDADPGDLPPPPGAVRRGSWRQASPAGLMQRAVYERRGAVAEAADHYVAALLDAGFTRHDNSRPAGGPVRLHFSKGRTHAVVTLRVNPRDTQTTLISFILLIDRKPSDTARPPAKEG